jgi:hypothetical protein
VTQDSTDAVLKYGSNGTLLGTFTSSGLSSPFFVAVATLSAVPEPSFYATLAGAVTLAFAAWRRRTE